MRRRTIRIVAAVLAMVLLTCQAGLAVRGEAGAGAVQPAAPEEVGGY